MRIVTITGDHKRHMYLIDQVYNYVGVGVGLSQAIVQKREKEKYASSLEFSLEHTSAIIEHTENVLVNTGSTYRFMDAYAPDIVITYGCCIIKEPLLSLIQPAYNLHLGIGDDYIGRDPITKAFNNKDKKSIGATFHKITKDLDKGEVIFTVKVPVAEDDTISEVTDRLVIESTRRIIEWLKEVE